MALLDRVPGNLNLYIGGYVMLTPAVVSNYPSLFARPCCIVVVVVFVVVVAAATAAAAAAAAAAALPAHCPVV